MGKLLKQLLKRVIRIARFPGEASLHDSAHVGFGGSEPQGKEISEFMRAGDLPLPLTLLEVRLVSRAVRRLIDSPDSLVPSEHLVLASVAARAEMRQGVSWGSDIEQSSLRRLSINRRGDTPSQRSDLGNKINALRKLIMSNYEER